MHQKEEITISYNKQKGKAYYICKNCDQMHTTKIEINMPINLDCHLKKECDFNRSWNTWSNKYCLRCNHTTLGITRSSVGIVIIVIRI